LNREFDWRNIEYYYAVAYNQYHESPPSDISNTTRAFWDEPSPPRHVKIKDTKDGTEISWEPPLLDGAGPILGYKILGSDDREEWTEIAYVPADQRSYLISSDEDEFKYYQVAADNEFGWTLSEYYDEKDGEMEIAIIAIIIGVIFGIIMIIFSFQIIKTGQSGNKVTGDVPTRSDPASVEGSVPSHQHDIDSLEDLEKRYVRGEISEDSYLILKDELKK
jgi:hypothetical protein